jgi:hypothetical protein
VIGGEIAWGIFEQGFIENGSGKIIEISGDQCLVDLENQPAKLWERMSATKPAP